MLDERTMTKDLAKVRRYVLWSLLPIPVVFAGVTMVFLLTEYGPSALGIGLVVCVVLAAWAAYVLCYWAVDMESQASRRWFAGRHLVVFGIGLAGMAAGLVIDLIFGHAASGDQGSNWPMLLSLLIASLVINAPDGKRKLATVGAALLTLPFAIPAALLLDGAWIWLPVSLPVFTFVMWSLWWTYGVALRLDAARKVSAELAVAQERLRFASELHDIQGQHLQVIALKSELAARLAAADPDTAVREMREVERLAREALTDTRAVVGGYRDVRLRTELANAVRVLGAAGISARSGLAAERTEVEDPGLERLLGLAVREATTNMIRHASPTRAWLNLQTEDGRIALTVRNDGVNTPPGNDARRGGLVGLRERFAEAGGELSWQHAGEEFVVTALVPERRGEGARGVVGDGGAGRGASDEPSVTMSMERRGEAAGEPPGDGGSSGR